MVTVEVGLCGEGRGDRERDVDVDVIDVVVSGSTIYIDHSHVELEGSLHKENMEIKI